MAEREAGDSGPTTKSPEEESSESNPLQHAQDLKHVLVTSVLNLEELDVDLYRGTHHWVPRSQRLFGGQIVGQALVAAAKSVGDNLYAHSLHCYFVRAGDPKVPVLYHVDRTRDGRSLSVRSVKAIQHGQAILTCQASFHTLEPSPIQHQFTMPVVPQPEDLLTVEELIHLYLSEPDLEETSKQGLNKLLANEVPLEMKPVNPSHLFRRRVMREPKQLFWVRARGHIGEGNMKLHCCVAAYVSDFALLGTAMLPYPNYRVQFAVSLDHAMWFHSTFRTDEWMLYECESPWAGRCVVHFPICCTPFVVSGDPPQGLNDLVLNGRFPVAQKESVTSIKQPAARCADTDTSDSVSSFINKHDDMLMKLFINNAT